MISIKAAFNNAHQNGRIALIGYLPVGFPDRQRFLEAAQAAFEAGLDILEIGMPTREASFDGQVIRTALEEAYRIGITVDEALELGAQVTNSTGGSGLAMFYKDALCGMSEDEFLDHCAELKISGILPVDIVGQNWLSLAKKAIHKNVSPVGFVTANMESLEMDSILKNSGGFVYLQSYNGPTGEPATLGLEVQQRISSVRDQMNGTPLPIAVGFGIRNGADVARVAELGADGAIVGTALVEAAVKGPQATTALIQEMVEGAFRKE